MSVKSLPLLESLFERAKTLGIRTAPDHIGFNFYHHPICFDGQTFFVKDSDLSPFVPTDTLIDAFCVYLKSSPDVDSLDDDPWVTFRELPGAGPLFAQFNDNTTKTLQQHFSGRLSALRQKCSKASGRQVEHPGFDLSIQFHVFPKVPMILNFNDADEMMPASVSFLYKRSTHQYLDIKSLGATCTYLTGFLVS